MYAVYITRCSGDFPQVKISKYTMGLPGLPEKVVVEKLGGNVTKEENALATGPGMYGRIWLGQSLAFDEAFQILAIGRDCRDNLHLAATKLKVPQ